MAILSETLGTEIDFGLAAARATCFPRGIPVVSLVFVIYAYLAQSIVS